MPNRPSNWRLWALLLVSLGALAGATSLTVVGLGSDPAATSPDATRPGTPAAAGSTAPPAPTDGPGGTPLSPTGSAPPAASPSPPPSPKEIGPQSLEPEQLTGYVWPLRNARITSRMAPRSFGGFVIIDGNEVHDGLDLATHCGDEILAAHDGTVLYAGRNFDVYLGYRGKPEQIYARLEQRGQVNTLPIVVVIDDGNGYRSMYVHLSRASVEAGEVVRAGDIIGREGATGYATGCHLHYGLIRMDAGWQQVVPRLARFGYPPLVRERIDPLRVLPWDDPYAPARLRNRVDPSHNPDPSPST